MTQLGGLLGQGNVLVITPHADDETLGCGGTIARCVDAGANVGVLLISTATVEHYGQTRGSVEASTRETEFDEAMRTLGVQQTDILFRDAEVHMRLDAMPRRDLVSAIETASPLSLDHFRPDLVLFPAASYNQDHAAVHGAVFTACRPHLPADKPFAQVVLSYEQPQLGWATSPFKPEVYVDISSYLQQKLDAYSCYRSQHHPEPHHGSIANLERLARLRGSDVSVIAAEAFTSHRILL